MTDATPRADQEPDGDEELPISRVLAATTRFLARVTRLLVIPAIIGAVVFVLVDDGRRVAVGAFLAGHLGFIWWALLIVGAIAARAYEAQQRWNVLMAPRKTKRTTTKPLMQKGGKAFAEWVDLLVFRDDKPWRVAMLATSIATAAACTFYAWDVTDWPFQQPANPEDVIAAPAVASIVAPTLWLAAVVMRLRAVSGSRAATIDSIHGIAKATLTNYPKPTARLGAEQIRLLNPYTAIDVREWETPTTPRRFYVCAPSEMSVTDGKAWNEFEVNLAAKVPHPEGWHVERDRNGRGAMVAPAKYPSSLIWDGEQDPDPLTFIVGADLDDPEVPLTFTLGETSPHILVTGGTGSGKTSLAEAIMAQAATKAMPWDPGLFATCHVIDPKGPFANRWSGRPRMDVTNGTRDTNIGGEVESGIVAMGYHMERIMVEMNERQAVLDQFPDIATWLHLPDGMKQKHKMAPVIIVMDEYLDHTGSAPGTSEAIQKDNAARERIQYIVGLIARKGRSLGFHLILIAQDATMTVVGGALIRQLVARAVLGNMDHHAYGRMFGNDALIPVLPNTRIVKGKEKTIPGRGRLMNAPGQPLRRMQVYWFGGSDNSETLNKYLPRAGADVLPAEAEAAATLIDEDGNGIPDAWDSAAADRADAEEQLPLDDPIDATAHEDADLAGSGEAQPTAPAVPDSFDWAALGEAATSTSSTSATSGAGADSGGFTKDDLDALLASVLGPEGGPAPTSPSDLAATPSAPSTDVDPDDDPDDPQPLDPDSFDDTALHIVGPETIVEPAGGRRSYSPLVADSGDLVDPDDIMGRKA